MTVELELTPEQPSGVVTAVSALLAPPPAPDPWWQAGIDDALAPYPGT
jgi:hypothetical protein